MGLSILGVGGGGGIIRGALAAGDKPLECSSRLLQWLYTGRALMWEFLNNMGDPLRMYRDRDRITLGLEGYIARIL